MMPSQVSTVLRGETFVGSPVEFYEALGVDLTEFVSETYITLPT